MLLLLARLATCLLGGGVLLLTAIVAWRHMAEWRRTPGRTGLIPLHIWSIAVSYGLMVVTLMSSAFGGSTSWRAWIYIPAMGLGLFALFVMVNFQRGYSHTRRREAEVREALGRDDAV